MPFKIVIDPRAISDIVQAVDYYNSKQIGLGEKFKTNLNKYIVRLSINPYYAFKYKDYRCLPLRQFPFLILFHIQEKDKKVLINAIFNTYQNPKKYPK
jgi:toxin ParE1/3/4